MRQTAERILIHPWRKEDGAEWVKLRSHSRQFIEPFEPSWPPRLTLDDFERRRTRITHELAMEMNYSFLLRRLSDKVLLGGLSLYHVRRAALQCATLSYWIGAPYARQGYMKEGLSLLETFAFEVLNLHRMEAYCLPNNYSSLALLRSAGFHDEGIALKYLRIQGEWQDHLRFAKINPLT